MQKNKNVKKTKTAGKPDDYITGHLDSAWIASFSPRLLSAASLQDTWMRNSRSKTYRFKLFCLPKISSDVPTSLKKRVLEQFLNLRQG